MKKIIILLALTHFTPIFKSNAQNEIEKKNTVTFDVMKAFPPLTRLNFGYYRSLNNRMIVGVNYGFSISKEDGRSRSLDYNLKEYSIEFQYILNPDKRTKKFISFETHYLDHNEKLVNGIAKIVNDNSPRTEYSYSNIDYQRTKLAFNFNYGMIIPFNKIKQNYGIIPKIGLGYRIRDVKFTNAVDLKPYVKENSNGFLYVPDYKIGTDMYEIAGKNEGLNFTISAKLFFKF